MLKSLGLFLSVPIDIPTSEVQGVPISLLLNRISKTIRDRWSGLRYNMLLFHETKDFVDKIFMALSVFKIQGIIENIAFWNPLRFLSTYMNRETIFMWSFFCRIQWRRKNAYYI